MDNRISLSTVALLTTLWEREQRDYLDVLGQFVRRCLPTEIDARIDIDEITAQLRSNYGFDDIPRQVVEKVLRRLAKTKILSKRYLRKENQQYYVAEAFDCSAFDAQRNETNALISDVLDALTQYLETNMLFKKIDLDEASDFLFHFFETYGLTFVHDSNSLRGITTDSGTHNFYVARFILEHCDRHTSIFDKLIKITTGFLIHKAVYFYTSEMKNSPESKLRNVNFYLDCSLVIETLGYDSQSDETACDEMIQLIRANGGKVCVFEHTIEEASRVLEAFARNPQSHNSFKLSALDARDYPSGVITSLATPEAIQNNLKRKGVIACPAPSYEPTRYVNGKPVYDGIEDEAAIEKQLLEYSYRKRNGLDDRLIFDAKTLSAIGRLRKGHHATHIEHCRAMAVTQGIILNKCMHDLYPDRFLSEIDFAINDLDLVSLLWLGQYNKESELPKNLLIANAVAACQFSDAMMEQAIDLAGRMEEDNTIPKEAALIVRSTQAIRPILFELTQNNPSHLTRETVKDAITTYVSQESSASTEAAIDKAVNENTARLSAEYQKKIDELKKNHAKEMQTTRKLAADMRYEAEQSAKEKAAFASKVVQKSIIAILSMLLIASIICWIIGGLTLASIPAVVLSILSLLQIVDYIRTRFSHSASLSEKVSARVFSKMLKKEIEKRENLSHIKISL